MLVRFALLVLFVFFCTSVVANEDNRYTTVFKSQNSNFILTFDSISTWTFQDQRGKAYYKIKDEGFTAMSIDISNDGKSIAVVDDEMNYFYNQSISNRKILWFFYNGILAKAFTLKNLLTDTCFVTYSSSHVHWREGQFGMDSSQRYFNFKSKDFFKYSLLLTTGEIVSKKRTDGIMEEDLVVWGEALVKNENETEIEFKIFKYLCGPKQPSNTLYFNDDKIRDQLENYLVIVFKVESELRPVSHIYSTFNGCIFH